jgi:deoxyribonuclease V
MILAVDVQYTHETARVAGVVFEYWKDDTPCLEVVSSMHHVACYEHGKFYKRELPCILHLLDEHNLYPEIIVIDGFVFLDGCEKPGLGKYLYDVRHGCIAVIGVAKSAFHGISPEYEIYRGRSRNPLYVTAVGMNVNKAKALVQGMRGSYRLPTLLKRVDQLCRS